MVRGRNPSLLMCEKAEHGAGREQMKRPLFNFARMEGKEEPEQKTRGVREVGCPVKGSEAEDGGLPSPRVSSEHSCRDQLPHGKILGNLSTDNANRKERPMVSQALCWALDHMCNFYGVSQLWSRTRY